MLVVSKGVDLLSRDWIEELHLALGQYGLQLAELEVSPEQVASLQANSLTLATALDNHFEDTVHGKLTTCKAKMYPPGEDRRISSTKLHLWHIKPKVDKHLDRMLKQGIIEEVPFSEYACPITVADKPNGNIRICRNLKLTANKVLNLEHYPIPSLEDMVQSLQGGVVFSKVDLSHAYNQVELEADSKKYTRNTKNHTKNILLSFCNEVETCLNEWQINRDLLANPNENYNIFDKIIMDAKAKYLSPKTVRFKKYKHKISPWMNHDILRSIKDRDDL